MKKLFLLAFAGILLAGCNKEDEISSDFQFGEGSHEVTGAVINLYDRSPEETNYEVYLLLDGFTWNDLEDDYFAAVYFDMYFKGSLSELPEGTYRLGNGETLDYYGGYSSYSATKEEYAEFTSGTLTISKKGDNYSFSFDGMAVLEVYNEETNEWEYSDPKPFKCSYSGPVEHKEEDFGDDYYDEPVNGNGSAPARMMKKGR